MRSLTPRSSSTARGRSRVQRVTRRRRIARVIRWRASALRRTRLYERCPVVAPTCRVCIVSTTGAWPAGRHACICFVASCDNRPSPHFSPRGRLAGFLAWDSGRPRSGCRGWRLIGRACGDPGRLLPFPSQPRAASTATRSIRGPARVEISRSAGGAGPHAAQIVVHGREDGLIGIRLRE
jgi:hypothetical protein